MPHIHSLIDFTVEVFVVHNDRVLLRLHDKYKIWLSVGGHIELNEDPNQAAVREVKEEVGLNIKLLDDLKINSDPEENYSELIPPKFINRHKINESHEHIALTYFATSDSDNVVPENTEDKWVWVTKDELYKMENLKPHIRLYAKIALEQLANK